MTTTWGPIVYPTGIDSFTPVLIDNVDEVIANHPNSLATAITAIETKLGISNNPVTGLGGVSFHPTGRAANPGTPGSPTIWVDNTGGPGFGLWYTDDTGTSYNLLAGGTGSALEDWAPTTVYSLNQEVLYVNLRFRCISAHTSGATFFNDTDLSKWECVSGEGFIVNQVAHGFSELDCIYSSSGTWALADSSDGGKLSDPPVLVIGVGTAVNYFLAAQDQIVTVTGHGLTVDEVYFLSSTVPGALTATEPTGTGEYTCPIVKVLSANSLSVLPYRPALGAYAILRDGSVTYVANQPMGGYKLTGLGPGTTAGDSVEYSQLLSVVASHTIDDAYDAFGSNPATIDIDNAEGQGSLQWNVVGAFDFIIDVSSAGSPYAPNGWPHVRGFVVQNGSDEVEIGYNAANSLYFQGNIDTFQLDLSGGFYIDASTGVSIDGHTGATFSSATGNATLKASDDVAIVDGVGVLLKNHLTGSDTEDLILDYNFDNVGTGTLKIQTNGVGTPNPVLTCDTGLDVTIHNQLFVADGTDAAPAIAFTSNTDVGFIYRSTSGGTVGVSVNDNATFATYHSSALNWNIVAALAEDSPNIPLLGTVATWAHGSTAVVGMVGFNGMDSGPAAEIYATIEGYCTDNTATSEKGALLFKTNVSGTQTLQMSILDNGVTMGASTVAQGQYTLAISDGLYVGPTATPVEFVVDSNGYVSSSYAGTLTSSALWEIAADATGSSSAKLLYVHATDDTNWNSNARGIYIEFEDTDFVPFEINYFNGETGETRFIVQPDGDVEMSGNLLLYTDGTVSAAGVLTLDCGATDYVRVGDGGTPTTATNSGDLFIENILEVGGVATFQDQIDALGSIKLPDDQELTVGTGNDVRLMWDAAVQTNDGLMLGLGASNYIALIEGADWGNNYSISNFSNPTLVIQSADHTTPAERLWIQHDGTNAVIGVDTGNLMIGSLSSYTLPTSTGAENQVLLLDASDDLQWSTPFEHRAATTVSTATYSALSTDGTLLVTRTATGTCTITISSALIADSSFRLEIKDAGFNASTYNITINTAGSETIDGQANAIINGDGDCLTLRSNGTNLFVV